MYTKCSPAYGGIVYRILQNKGFQGATYLNWYQCSLTLLSTTVRNSSQKNFKSTKCLVELRLITCAPIGREMCYYNRNSNDDSDTNLPQNKQDPAVCSGTMSVCYSQTKDKEISA